MGAGRTLKIVGGSLVGGLATAAVAGVVAERRIVRKRRRAARDADRLGTLRGRTEQVRADDGIVLHAEVDEVSPHGTGRAPDPDAPTIVFVHGYCLNLDCWHFQRERLRGKYRMVFYDQRSHGRSERAPRDSTDVDQLGHDLRAVIEQLAPTGPLVLVGHSMGGMSVMALAEHHPGLLEERVAGVALVATTAGDLVPSQILSRRIPARLGGPAATRLVASLAKAPELVDSARRGSNLGFLAADLFAFGQEAPPEQVEFLDRMLAQTSFEVIADFFPGLTAHSKYTALEHLDRVPTTVVAGTKDRITPVAHSRKLAELMPRATYLEIAAAGHMVIFEAADEVTGAIEALVPDAGALERAR